MVRHNFVTEDRNHASKINLTLIFRFEAVKKQMSIYRSAGRQTTCVKLLDRYTYKFIRNSAGIQPKSDFFKLPIT